MEEVVVEVTAVPEEPEEPVVEEGVFAAPDPETYTYVTFGDIDTMDPNLCYDTASAALILNVMEGLIFFNREKMTEYVPVLATEIPTVENGGISEDGLTYTFNIREGVTFHNGNDLTPSDFEYTFERGLLQSDPNGPQWLLIEPILGYASGDITEEIADGEYAGDPEALRANATPEELMAVCEKVKASVVADDEAGTLTFNLAQPWGPLLATLAQSWGAVMDKEWAIENGAWDGACETWAGLLCARLGERRAVDHHQRHRPLQAGVLDAGRGVGPGRQRELLARGRRRDVARWPQWRAEDQARRPASWWTSGAPALPCCRPATPRTLPCRRPTGRRWTSSWARSATMRPTNARPPRTPTRRCASGPTCPAVSRTNVFMNFDLSQEEGTNPYIGSGQLDGNGIPPTSFNDIHVRKAFNYCFDYETYIADALNGEGMRNNGPIIFGMLGYNPDGPMYDV